VLRGRREVANFARRILATLNKPKNADKPGWEAMSILDMIFKLEEEFLELKYELATLDVLIESKSMTTSQLDIIRKNIVEEATDLGAVCMMIADNAGGLDDT
jgi:hypothetical protein